MLLERGVAFPQQVVDVVVVAEVILGWQTLLSKKSTICTPPTTERSAGGWRLISSLMTLGSLWCSSASHRRGLPSASAVLKRRSVASGLIRARTPCC